MAINIILNVITPLPFIANARWTLVGNGQYALGGEIKFSYDVIN